MRWFRAVPGAAALLAFFLPWMDGTGPLSGVAFSGYELVGYTGALRQLESMNGMVLAPLQVGVLLTAVAATWLAILATRNTWGPLRLACGGYVLLVGSMLLATGIAQGEFHGGALLTAGAGMAFVAVESGQGISRLWQRRPLLFPRSPGHDAPAAG